MSSGTHLFKPSVSTDTQLQPSEYTLSVLQQPNRVRVSTHKEKGRKSLDPPPIIQLHLPQRTEQGTMNLLQSPCLFICANLAHPRDDNEVYTPSHNALSGQVVSSLYKLTNEQNEVNGYFLFGDLSVKVNGVFRLKLSLFEINSEGSVYKSSIFSDPFTAYSARTYPGTLEPTSLSKLFYAQGARLRLPKDYGGSNQINRPQKRKLDDEEESLDSDCNRHEMNSPINPAQAPIRTHYSMDPTQPYQYHPHPHPHPHAQQQQTQQQHPYNPPYCPPVVTALDRRHSLTSTEDGGSPQSIHTPLSPLQELLPFSTQTQPMIRLPPLKFNMSPWQQQEQTNNNGDPVHSPIFLPPLHSLVTYSTTPSFL